MNSENIILGQILIENDIWYKINLREDDFLNPQNTRIFSAIKTTIDNGLKADLITITNHDKSIDPAYIASLTSIGITGNYEYHCKQIKEQAALHYLSLLPAQISDRVNSKKYGSKEILEDIEKLLVRITTRQAKDKIKHIKEVLFDFTTDLEKRVNSGAEIDGISTGFKTLDSMTGGFCKGLFYILGARPSGGKTAMALNMLMDASRRQKKSVGVISLESGCIELVRRIIASESRVSLSKLKSGLLKTSDFSSILSESGEIAEISIYFYDVPNMNLSEVKSQARRMVSFYGVNIIFIDYISLIDNYKAIPRHEQMAEVSKQLKGLARELQIPIVALSQLGRQSDGRRPHKGDLAESRQLEQDADVIMLLHHEKNDSNEIESSYLIIDKSRDGETGVIDMKFKGEYVTFKELAK
jgi:replicative DNA helicase